MSGVEALFEWGLEGALSVAGAVDVAIIVDVLSFTTCVEVAVSRGAHVFPYPYKDNRANAFARLNQAILAHPVRSHEAPCLSPQTLFRLAIDAKLVLPSPNGATVSLAIPTKNVLAGCFRNAAAVAKAASSLGKTVVVIAAGEQWTNGSLRPALEDMVGAGAILSELQGASSPEAIAAVEIFQRFRSDLHGAIATTTSGLELAALGFAGDTEVASALNVSSAVPILKDGAFVAMQKHP